MPNGRVLIDPQLYLPHSFHERLSSHSYWPKDYDSAVTWEGPALAALLDALALLNEAASATAMILPGTLAQRVDDDWIDSLGSIFEESQRFASRFELYGTLALSAEAAANGDAIGEIIEAAETWPVKSFYVVCEHPKGDYLVKDPNWLASILDLVAGLRLMKRRVVVGYCNHQMLVAACAKATAIASGTWMNVRAFPPEKFETKYDEEIKQRATWYYCPQVLSEYTLPFLDFARRAHILNDMAPTAPCGNDYVENLFAGPPPTTVGFSEHQAFRHYLDCLRTQVMAAEAPTFDETVARHQAMLNQAESSLATFRANGVLGNLRDFHECIDVNRAALQFLVNTRGPLLRRNWSVI